MQTRLRLFLEWGITFGEPYQVPQRAARKVYYASKAELTSAIYRAFPSRQGQPIIIRGRRREINELL